jgi:hypothetical protein
MKLRIKDVIAIVIIAALGYFMVVQRREIIRQETFLKAQEIVVENWTDKHNMSNSKAERIEGDLRTIRELYKMQTDTIESLQGKLKRKEIVSYQKVDAVVKNTIVAEAIEEGDTVRFEYKDKYTRVTGVLTDKFTIELEQVVPLHLYNYKERSGFFKKTTYVHAVSTNPNVVLTGVSSIVVKEKIKRFGLGVQVGMTYIDTGFRPYLGVGLSYNFIRF